MTLLTWIRFTPQKRNNIKAPLDICPSDITLILPVRNNQSGVDRFFAALAMADPCSRPGEIIIVDNDSEAPVIAPVFPGETTSVRVIRCFRRGPAAARNEGASHARGEWLLFSDSDCIPESSFVSGYASALDGAVAYAGYVAADGRDALSRYYESQDILVPPRVNEDRPQCLITANALVWRHAFGLVGGFDESYPFAGGEDIDLGFRLTEIGSLSYAPASVVRHDFSDGFAGFAKRFYRYGRGNRRLAHSYGIDLRPRFFAPTRRSAFNWCAAVAQFVVLTVEYAVEALVQPRTLYRRTPPTAHAVDQST